MEKLRQSASRLKIPIWLFDIFMDARCANLAEITSCRYVRNKSQRRQSYGMNTKELKFPWKRYAYVNIWGIRASDVISDGYIFFLLNREGSFLQQRTLQSTIIAFPSYLNPLFRYHFHDWYFISRKPFLIYVGCESFIRLTSLSGMKTYKALIKRELMFTTVMKVG